MPGPGESPEREPEGEARIDHAADPKERLAQPEPRGRREDGRLEDDAKAARDDDGRAERGEEDGENVAAVPRHSLGSFGVHAGRFRGCGPKETILLAEGNKRYKGLPSPRAPTKPSETACISGGHHRHLRHGAAGLAPDPHVRSRAVR